MENSNHRVCDKYSTEMFQEEYDGLSVVRYLGIVTLKVPEKTLNSWLPILFTIVKWK